ncbi:unnamed protein product [Staurois parvus]|uniref:Uncharacterized protein n=1 Tax=Staurois parvus TaxID=386267 RepID=A0ABN9FW04_9NEOB|nr:unnamed protein product [Staurois parvus]
MTRPSRTPTPSNASSMSAPRGELFWTRRGRRSSGPCGSST